MIIRRRKIKSLSFNPLRISILLSFTRGRTRYLRCLFHWGHQDVMHLSSSFIFFHRPITKSRVYVNNSCLLAPYKFL
jgi:hypothetical protein